MVRVKVGGQKVVDVIDPGGVDGGHDTVWIAAVASVVPRIDQESLAGRRHHQGRLPALDVDEIDGECPGSGRWSASQHYSEERRETDAGRAAQVSASSLISRHLRKPQQ